MILEQRKYVRIKKPYITRYKVIPNDNKITKDWDGVAVVNLSAGGIFIYSRTNLEVGTILDLKIGFSHYYPTKICVGKVIRAKRYQAISIYGYSVEFTEIDEQTRKMINKNLEITKWQPEL
jgi:c-di-GMP-binding flagellar brake protein YcgR